MENLIENPFKKTDEDGEEKKKRPIIKSATDLQRLKLEKLMKNPDKPIIIPEQPREKDYMQTVPSFVRNVMGSSAGAGSGEFHVYRHLRRKEYARQKCIQAKSIREQLDEEYQMKLEKNRLEAEAKTAKKRAKRLKKKQRAKKPRTKQNDQKEDETHENTSEEDEDEEDEKDTDATVKEKDHADDEDEKVQTAAEEGKNKTGKVSVETDEEEKSTSVEERIQGDADEDVSKKSMEEENSVGEGNENNADVPAKESVTDDINGETIRSSEMSNEATSVEAQESNVESQPK